MMVRWVGGTSDAHAHSGLTHIRVEGHVAQVQRPLGVQLRRRHGGPMPSALLASGGGARGRGHPIDADVAPVHQGHVQGQGGIHSCDLANRKCDCQKAAAAICHLTPFPRALCLLEHNVAVHRLPGGAPPLARHQRRAAGHL